MAQPKRKFKSPHDNISLEGLDAVFDIQSLKEKELEVLEKPAALKLNDIVSNTFKKKLKLKNNRKAFSKFVEDLPVELQFKDCTVFENVSTKKLKNKRREVLKEIIKLVVVHDSKEKEEIAYLEAQPIIDVIPEREKSAEPRSTTVARQLEDQLTSAYCKIDILKAKETELQETITKLKANCTEREEEILWIKSQQDKIATKLNKLERTWWWRFRSWVTGKDE